VNFYVQRSQRIFYINNKFQWMLNNTTSL
jgi:hypothetical protein